MNKMETMYDSRAYVRNHKFIDELRRLYSQDYITCDEMKICAYRRCLATLTGL